ncbi:WASH complex subunit 1 [Anoplophora glabripennis]|uniref:WASH complex subunit 1 n=1 Tax=Anoplophora glabripennis TaxID=217634 RepID=UPI0008743DB4|nr:WASH complex subunit 1 [Anoplophora glabripennis]
MNSNYSVPLIPQNLNKHETIIQIAEVLNHLTNVTESIFGIVEKRLDSNKNKLTDISQRVDAVNKKINKLKGAKKATQVFSSSRYPAGETYREYVSTFSDAPPLELKRHKVKSKNLPSSYEPLDKLQFYHVNVSSDNKQEKLEGLGDIPQDVHCVNNLLLYNSGKNLYRNFVIADALKGPRNVREEDENDISDIGPAPHSISERSTLTKSTTQNYFYTPQIGEVPALDVPLDLPDLPGIADDLHYDSEVGPGIAPSAVVTPNIIENVDLPVIEQSEPDVKEADHPNISLPPPLPPVTELPKPPPAEQNHIPPVPEEIKEDLPKPPEVKQEAPTQLLPKIDIPPPNDVRSSLMEAIRKAGGSKKAKLRSVKEPPKEVSKPPGGDLMADLHLKLSMRRKGISGAKKQENSVDPDSTLGKISAMIPPPEPKTDIDSNSNDEDWE